MSMPEELSKYIHDFLRGPSKSGETRGRHAKEQWLYRNSVKGFKVGQVFKGNFELYTVIKVGAMVTFECDGKQIRRKPKLIKAHLHREEDSRHDHWRCDDWVVALDKETELKFTDIYAPVPVRVVKAQMPEPESDEDVPLAVIAARIANNNY